MATIIEYIKGEPVMRYISDYISYPNSGHVVNITYDGKIIADTGIMSFEIDIEDETQYEIVEYDPVQHKIIFDISDIQKPGTMCARYYKKFRLVIGCDDRIFFCEGYVRDEASKLLFGVLGTELKYELNAQVKGEYTECEGKYHTEKMRVFTIHHGGSGILDKH